VAQFSSDSHALGLARIEAHYFVNGSFLPAAGLMADLDRIRRSPTIIVQGRYDMVCPIVTADELTRAWPEAEYVIVPDAGHSALEPGVRTQLIRATDRFRSFAEEKVMT
jgi:proline iminopeptidase